MTNPQGDGGWKSSVRIVAELLAVAAIGWLASTVTTQNTSIAVLTTEVKQLQASLSDMPALAQNMYVMQTQVAEHERRITSLEQRVEKTQ